MTEDPERDPLARAYEGEPEEEGDKPRGSFDGGVRQPPESPRTPHDRLAEAYEESERYGNRR